MGTSIWLVVIIPLMFFGTIFSDISGAIFGYPTEEIALPYDEEKGLVWEYDCVNDPNIELVKTEIRDGEQVFVFVGKGKVNIKEIFSKDEDAYQGNMMDLVFTDENGNQKIYYGYNGNRINEPQFYCAEDCQTIDITLNAQKARKNASWEVVANGGYVVMKKTTGGETENFTIIVTPDTKDGTYATYGMFDVEFAYTNSRGKYLEEAKAVFELQDGKHILKSVEYEDFWDKMFTDLKHILETE